MLFGAAAGAAIFVHFAPCTKVSSLATLSCSMWQVMYVLITANVAADRDGQTAWAVVPAADCMSADAWAAALRVAGTDDGLALARRVGLTALFRTAACWNGVQDVSAERLASAGWFRARFQLAGFVRSCDAAASGATHALRQACVRAPFDGSGRDANACYGVMATFSTPSR